jgi:cell division transport system ATP-binding protein
MIKFDRVNKRYPGSFDAIKNVSFEIEQGDLVFVTGASGAGKSTLLKLIAGLERPSSGTVLIGNQNVSHLKANAIPYLRRKFGLIFQDHKLLYDRNCYENVALPLYINGTSPEDTGKRVRAALDKVGLLNKEKSMPITLSGGEQQRLAIARAVVSRPAILIADEPTGNLDETYAADILDFLYEFQRVGATVIIASHEVPKNIPDSVKPSVKILHLQHGELDQ